MKTNRIIFALILIIAALFALMFAGCSASKRLARIEKKHPELFKNSVRVTVRHDTLISREISKDSTIHNIYSRDTVFLRENRLTVKYLYKGGDSAYLGGTVRADTIIKVVSDTLRQKTLIKEVKAPKTAIDWLMFWWFWVAVAFVVIKYGGPLIMEMLRKIPGFPL